MQTAISKINKLDFNFIPTSIFVILNKHIKINDNIFYVKRTNEFGESVLQTIQPDNSYTTVGNITLINKRYFKIVFRYNNLPAEVKIKHSDIRYNYSESN